MQSSTEILECEVTAEFSLDTIGEIKSSFRSALAVEEIEKAVKTSLTSFLASVKHRALPGDDDPATNHLQFRMHLFLLENSDDILGTTFEISAGTLLNDQDIPNLEQICLRLVSLVRIKFLSSLTMQCIDVG